MASVGVLGSIVQEGKLPSTSEMVVLVLFIYLRGVYRPEPSPLFLCLYLQWSLSPPEFWSWGKAHQQETRVKVNDGGAQGHEEGEEGSMEVPRHQQLLPDDLLLVKGAIAQN